MPVGVVDWALSTKRIIGAPPPTDFCKNYLYEGINLETWNLACKTLVPSLAQKKKPDLFHLFLCKELNKAVGCYWMNLDDLNLFSHNFQVFLQKSTEFSGDDILTAAYGWHIKSDSVYPLKEGDTRR